MEPTIRTAASRALGLVLLAWPAAAAPQVATPPPITDALSAAASFARGADYDVGRFGTPDPQAALAWYRRAADGEFPAAQLNAAVMYDSGRGTARDPSQAAMWYAASAAHGDGRAAFDMGQLYADGDGVPRNAEMAREWFRVAAARGIQAASHRLVASDPTPPQDDAEGTLKPAPPLRPARMSLAPYRRDVALVWAAPPQPRSAGPVRVYVQLVAREGDRQHMIFAGFATASALLVSLPAGRSDYAWRTLTISAVNAHYVASDWARFSADVGKAKVGG